MKFELRINNKGQTLVYKNPLDTLSHKENQFLGKKLK